MSSPKLVLLIATEISENWQCDGQVVVLDVPSFYIAYQQRVFSTSSGVGEYLPPELLNAFDQGDLANQPRTIHGDSWTFGVLVFKGLFEFHPFANGEMADVETVIKSGAWPYDTNDQRYHPKTASPPLTALPSPLISLFTRCFVAGMSDPSQRPQMIEWHAALEEWIDQEERSSRKSPQPKKAPSTAQNSIPGQPLATAMALAFVVLFLTWMLMQEPVMPIHHEQNVVKETPQLWLDIQKIQHDKQGELQ